MRKVEIFNNISLDGYFTDANGDMSWAKVDSTDPEFSSFVSDNASGDSVLVFGRVTHDLMARFWPTPMAAQAMPVVAARMNSATKLVFSRSLKPSPWNNTTIVAGDPATAIAKLKNAVGPALTVLGSGSIVAQLTKARLIDEYQIVVNPVILGAGRTQFEGADKLELKLDRTRAFKNGKVFMVYVPT